MRWSALGLLSARDDHFRDAVLGQELTESRPSIEQVLDAAVGKDSLDRKRLGHLHVYGIGIREMKAAISGLFRLLARVEESENLAAKIH